MTKNDMPHRAPGPSEATSCPPHRKPRFRLPALAVLFSYFVISVCAPIVMAQTTDNPFAKASRLATSATDAIVPVVASVAILVTVICGIIMMFKGRFQLGLLAGAGFGLIVAALARPIVNWVFDTISS